MTASNRVAIVTGASRGLGVVIARVLAERGHDLVIGASHAQPSDGGRGTSRGTGRTVSAIDGDITDAARAPAASRRPRARRPRRARQQRLGARPHRPVAGIRRPAIRPPLSSQRRRADRVDAAGGAAARRPPRPHRQHHERRCRGAYPGWGPYGASKAALELLTRTLAAELATRVSRRCSSIRATCARACSRRRFPARTSPIGRCPR